MRRPDRVIHTDGQINNRPARLDQPARATELHQRALAIFHEAGERDGEASALNGLGEAAHTTAHHAAALTTTPPP